MSACVENLSLDCTPWGARVLWQESRRGARLFVAAGLLVLLLLAYAWVATLLSDAAESRALVASSAATLSGLTYSGDDLYDRATGANPARSILTAARTFGGDDAYDRAAGSYPALFVRSSVPSLSGDDAYDLAAGGYPALSVGSAAFSLSGDDAYDWAAGSRPALFVRAAKGSFSGDDVYDPAAGGHPQ